METSILEDSKIVQQLDYWSDTCNRKEMAEAVAQGVREVYANGELGPSSAELTTKKIKNKPFVLIASNDFWEDGQWLRYWEERMKAYGAVVQPDEQIPVQLCKDVEIVKALE